MLMFRSKSMLELNTPREVLLLIFCISQGSVVTHLRCGGKYDTITVSNLVLSPTVKEFFKICQHFSELWTTIEGHIFYSQHVHVVMTVTYSLYQKSE